MMLFRALDQHSFFVRSTADCATGTMYGPGIEGSGNGQHSKVKAVYCAKEDIYVFAVYDHVFLKMVGAKLAQLEASSKPSVVSRYFTYSKKSDVDLTNQDQLCKVWTSDGYKTSSIEKNKYLLKDVVVDKKYCAGGSGGSGAGGSGGSGGSGSGGSGGSGSGGSGGSGSDGSVDSRPHP